MEGNKEEAIRCLSIASRYRSNSNLNSALKFARKSVTLYSTPEAEALIVVIQREIESGGSSSTATSSAAPTPQKQPSPSPSPVPNGNGNGGGKARASGVEEHVTSAHSRPGHGSKSTTSASASASTSSTTVPKKREYTPKQIEVVKRVKSCKHHEYYEILAVEKSCNENDVKRAYKKLALVLHPDKNGAPGADEAFKMVSKAFQVLSDPNLRAAFDSNPSYDPTQRNPGPSSRGGGMSGFGGGGGGPGMYQTEINPEDLFNMFFGGGGGGGFGGGSPFGQANVFTFGGPGGFQAQYGGRRRPVPRQAAGGTAGDAQSPLVALLPIIILFLFAIISIIPSLFSASAIPDPGYSYEASNVRSLGRETVNWNVPYFVNVKEWEGSELWKSVPEGRRGKGKEGLYSSKLRGFERGIENNYARRLQNDCQYFLDLKQQRINENSGFFGIGANIEKIKEIRKTTSPACEQLNKWGIGTAAGW